MAPSAERINPVEAKRNRLLAALPMPVLEMFCERLEWFDLNLSRRIYGADEPIRSVVFPLSGAVSLIAETPEGETADTQLVGRDGFVGLPVFLGTHQMPVRATVQVPGEALSMPAEAFRSLLGEDAVRNAFEYYTQMAMVELSQSLLCNRVHNTTARTARCLLELVDKVGETEFRLTQEFFAMMLGVARPQITAVVGDFRNAGFISYSRARVAILDRAGLERAACACYVILRAELDRLRTSEPSYG